MALYSLDGGPPGPLTFHDMFDPEGVLWKDVAASPEGLAACGLELVPDPPVIDATTQACTWDAGAKAWVVTPLPGPTFRELQAAAAMAVAEKITFLIAAGFPYAGEVVPLDPATRDNLNAIAAKALAVDAGKTAWTASYAQGVVVVGGGRLALATADDGFKLADAVGDYYAAILQHFAELQVAIAAATEAADLPDPTAGWPATA